MSDSTVHGSCLCGAVNFEARAPFMRMVHCHCSRCRKSSGTGHATNLVVAPAQFRWLSGEAFISRYKLPTAKTYGKWFCSQCGSPVPRLTRNDTIFVIPAGALDEAPPVSPSDHLFWGSRASWACGTSGLPAHEEYPPTW